MRDGTDTFGQRLAAVGLAVLTALVLAFLVAPILIVVPLSFSSGSFLYYPLPGSACAGTRISSRRRSGCRRSGTA